MHLCHLLADVPEAGRGHRRLHFVLRKQQKSTSDRMTNICSTVKRVATVFVTGASGFEPCLQLLGESCQTVMREKRNPLVGVRWELSCIFVVRQS